MHIITCVNHDGDMNIDFTIIVGGVGSGAALCDRDGVLAHHRLFHTVYRVLCLVALVVLAFRGLSDAVGEGAFVVLLVFVQGAGCVVRCGIHTEQRVGDLWLVVSEVVI